MNSYLHVNPNPNIALALALAVKLCILSNEASCDLVVFILLKIMIGIEVSGARRCMDVMDRTVDTFEMLLY